MSNTFNHTTVNDEGSIFKDSIIKKAIFTEPHLPIHSFKHYNFYDTYLMSYLSIYILVGFINLFYTINFFVIFTLIACLFLITYRMLQIMEILHVYNYNFACNGVIISFASIKDIKYQKNSLRLKIEYDKKKDSDLKMPDELVFYKKDELKIFIEQYNKAKSYIIISETKPLSTESP